MRFFCQILFLLPLVFLGACSDENWQARISPELKVVEKRQAEVKRELERLGDPLLGQTVPQFGYMARVSDAPESKGTFVQLDLKYEQPVTAVVLVPAQTDWLTKRRPSYSFPKRFRVDISNDQQFSKCTNLADFTGRDFPDPGQTPVIFRANGKRERYVRVTVFSPRLFALAELMVMKENRNLTFESTVTANQTTNALPRWDMKNLVDGRTPMGAPVVYEDLKYDGLYARPGKDGDSVWMQIDLRRETAVEEVRLHPVHGQHGLDIPGYMFPARFRLLGADDAGFESRRVLYESAPDFPNPGNNPVTIPVRNARMRYVRIELIEPGLSAAQERQFGLSEMEVYAGGKNVARQAGVVVDSTTAEHGKESYLREILVDGKTSQGRILELQDWLDSLVLRKELEAELQELNGRQVQLLAKAARSLWILLGGLVLAFIMCIAALWWNARRIRKRELDLFRRRLAQDLHDEVGSNLAAIGIISETVHELPAPKAALHWKKVNDIAREAADAMRETLWLSGGTVETRLNLMQHLRLVAARMLPDRTVQWDTTVEYFPSEWPSEAHKQVFLFFKEAIANIVRHSDAENVGVAVRIADGWLTLEIRDDGRGFQPDRARAGIGLASLKDRAARLGGVMNIETAPNKGTCISMRVRIRR